MTILQRHAPPGATITPTTSIVGDLALDSLAVMEVIAEVEDRFGITIPDDALAELGTVGDVLRALESRLRAKGQLQ